MFLGQGHLTVAVSDDGDLGSVALAIDISLDQADGVKKCSELLQRLAIPEDYCVQNRIERRTHNVRDQFEGEGSS